MRDYSIPTGDWADWLQTEGSTRAQAELLYGFRPQGVVGRVRALHGPGPASDGPWLCWSVRNSQGLRATRAAMPTARCHIVVRAAARGKILADWGNFGLKRQTFLVMPGWSRSCHSDLVWREDAVDIIRCRVDVFKHLNRRASSRRKSFLGAAGSATTTFCSLLLLPERLWVMCHFYRLG